MLNSVTTNNFPDAEPFLLRAPTPPVDLADLPWDQELKILVLPDLHLPLSNRHKEALLSHRSFIDSHDWVILLGDVTACYGTPGEYAEVRDFISQLDRPYSVVNGNHEFAFEAQSDGSVTYGKVWRPSGLREQRLLLNRFEQFYGLASRYHAYSNDRIGCILLGVDEVHDDSSAGLLPEREMWLADQLDQMQDVPLLIFCHFPLMTSEFHAIRYYEQGRRPAYVPSGMVESRLALRSKPAWWLSGHVHFGPTHPYFAPYQCDSGVWQIHCPDGRGFGRADNDQWKPQSHDRMVVRSLAVSPKDGSLVIRTVDLTNRIATDVCVSEWVGAVLRA